MILIMAIFDKVDYIDIEPALVLTAVPVKAQSKLSKFNSTEYALQF